MQFWSCFHLHLGCTECNWGLEEELVGCVMGYGFWFGVFWGECVLGFCSIICLFFTFTVNTILCNSKSHGTISCGQTGEFYIALFWAASVSIWSVCFVCSKYILRLTDAVFTLLPCEAILMNFIVTEHKPTYTGETTCFFLRLYWNVTFKFLTKASKQCCSVVTLLANKFTVDIKHNHCKSE